MRIRSIHPKYLDKAGLVACRRETLLAKHVLLGNTKGYKNHPQLLRFKEQKDPIKAIDAYLYHLHQEAITRKYKFDEKKFQKSEISVEISIHDQQIDYEFQHLLKKLYTRDRKKYEELGETKEIESHPIFKISK